MATLAKIENDIVTELTENSLQWASDQFPEAWIDVTGIPAIAVGWESDGVGGFFDPNAAFKTANIVAGAIIEILQKPSGWAETQAPAVWVNVSSIENVAVGWVESGGTFVESLPEVPEPEPIIPTYEFAHVEGMEITEIQIETVSWQQMQLPEVWENVSAIAGCGVGWVRDGNTFIAPTIITEDILECALVELGKIVLLGSGTQSWIASQLDFNNDWRDVTGIVGVDIGWIEVGNTFEAPSVIPVDPPTPPEDPAIEIGLVESDIIVNVSFGSPQWVARELAENGDVWEDISAVPGCGIGWLKSGGAFIEPPAGPTQYKTLLTPVEFVDIWEDTEWNLIKGQRVLDTSIGRKIDKYLDAIVLTNSVDITDSKFIALVDRMETAGAIDAARATELKLGIEIG